MATKTAGKILKRSRTKRMITGVCGGLGEYFGIDANLVRLGVMLVAVFTGFVPVLIVYIIAAMMLPE